MVLDASWSHFTSVGNELIITFDPNESDDTRQVTVTVTAGDIFDTILFFQNPNE
ncbi:MAG: hypothetical protein LIP09_08560 [Bacteroidales bacterium]|nr:hypothetical protein [Bacteroidales bacterium]